MSVEICARCKHTKAWHEAHHPRHSFRAAKPKLKSKTPVIVVVSERYRLVLVEYNSTGNQVVIEERKRDVVGGDCWIENCRFNPHAPLVQLVEALVRKVGGAP